MSENITLESRLHDAIDKWSNSFLRPHIPPKLMSNSTVTRTEDDGAKLIYIKFLYGEKTGKYELIPFNGNDNSEGDVRQESLWSYSLGSERIPDGFAPQKPTNNGYIHTGRAQKCTNCRGQGVVTCKKCNGKIRWQEKSGDNYIEKVCSCGDGKQTCETCTGFGEMETIITVQKAFRLSEEKNSEYTGEVPEQEIKKISGIRIIDDIVEEYPIDDLKELMRGGLNAKEFEALQEGMLEKLYERIDIDILDKGVDVDTKKIRQQLRKVFASAPNAGQTNVLLEKEVIPIRVMLRVEDAPVKQVDYTFKDKDYSLWVYGNENAVWYQSIPFSFNYKIIILLVALLGVVGLWLAKTMHFIN